MNLKEKVFQDHNELTLRDGYKYITVCNTIVCTKNNASYFGKSRYDLDLEHNDCNDRDIMKAVNPFTNEVIYERDETDWSKVPVDTKVLVRNGDCEKWIRAYFYKIEDDKRGYNFLAWDNGANSWSSDNNSDFASSWKQCKLYKE